MRKRMKCLLLTGLCCSLLSPIRLHAEEPEVQQTENEEFQYIHDPRLDSQAMADIVVDQNTPFGFRPAEDSVRLGAYASADWTNVEDVMSWREERIAYFESYDVMYELWQTMEAEDKSVEEIARAVSAKRNELRLESYANDPEGLEKVKQSNLETYGNENGPTAESLFEKYGDWETVLKKAFSSNSGMDACLGLYDDRYEYNIALGAAKTADEIYYVVQAKDSLSKIAKKYYGTGRDWKRIYEANKDNIQNPDLIYVGQILKIEE